MNLLTAILLLLTPWLVTSLEKPLACPVCQASVRGNASQPLGPSRLTGCHVRMVRGYAEPDLSCTPGAFNPTVTLAILRSGEFRTACVRDCASTRTQKTTAYKAYGIVAGSCNGEADHAIPLEIGGADTLDNIWPECDTWHDKDLVENYLAREVKAGRIPLLQAQIGIARDWTQYLAAAKGKK